MRLLWTEYPEARKPVKQRENLYGSMGVWEWGVITYPHTPIPFKLVRSV